MVRGASGANEEGITGKGISNWLNGMSRVVMGARRLMILEACANATKQEEEAGRGPGGVCIDEVPSHVLEKDQVGSG